jgi:hypothetical protein
MYLLIPNDVCYVKEGHVCINVAYKQYWPKVTHAKKRTSHAGCNACDARFTSHLLLECQMKRASCVQHLRGMCVGYCSGSMWHMRVTRVGCALLKRLSRVCHVLQMSRTSSGIGSARNHRLLLVSTCTSISCTKNQINVYILCNLGWFVSQQNKHRTCLVV